MSGRRRLIVVRGTGGSVFVLNHGRPLVVAELEASQATVFVVRDEKEVTTGLVGVVVGQPNVPVMVQVVGEVVVLRRRKDHRLVHALGHGSSTARWLFWRNGHQSGVVLVLVVLDQSSLGRCWLCYVPIGSG